MTAKLYITDFANRLGLSPETVTQAQRILESYPGWNGADVEPRSVAAAALHVAGGFTGEERTPSEVVAATGILEQDLEWNLANFNGRVGPGVGAGIGVGEDVDTTY